MNIARKPDTDILYQTFLKAEPYNLKTNELPQGEFLIGKDIPLSVPTTFMWYTATAVSSIS